MFRSKIKLDKDLIDRCKQHAQEAGYSSVEEFITHVLEKEINKHSGKPEKIDTELKKQFQGLGYID